MNFRTKPYFMFITSCYGATTLPNPQKATQYVTRPNGLNNSERVTGCRYCQFYKLHCIRDYLTQSCEHYNIQNYMFWDTNKHHCNCRSSPCEAAYYRAKCMELQVEYDTEMKFGHTSYEEFCEGRFLANFDDKSHLKFEVQPLRKICLNKIQWFKAVNSNRMEIAFRKPYHMINTHQLEANNFITSKDNFYQTAIMLEFNRFNHIAPIWSYASYIGLCMRHYAVTRGYLPHVNVYVQVEREEPCCAIINVSNMLGITALMMNASHHIEITNSVIMQVQNDYKLDESAYIVMAERYARRVWRHINFQHYNPKYALPFYGLEPQAIELLCVPDEVLKRRSYRKVRLLNEYSSDDYSDYSGDRDLDEELLHPQMFSLDELSIKIDFLNTMVENEKDRNLCKKLLEKNNLTDLDILPLSNPIFKKFNEYCNNYSIKPICQFIQPINIKIKEDRKQIISELKSFKIKSLPGLDYKRYIISNWLKIDDFIDELNKQNKGQQHKILIQVMQELNDKWTSTFYHNTNASCRRLIKKFEYLDIKSHIRIISKFEKKLKYFYQKTSDGKSHNEFISELEDQMYKWFSDVSEATHNANQASRNIVNLTEDAKEFTERANRMQMPIINKVNAMLDKCDDITEKFLKIMNTMEESFNYAGLFMMLIKFISFGYLVSQESNRNMTNIAALVTLILPTGIGNTLIADLSRAVMGVVSHLTNETAQAPNDPEQISYTFGSALLSSIKTVIQSIFGGIHPEAYQELRANTYYLKTISDLIRSTTTIGTFFIKAITTTLEFVVNKVMEWYGILPMFLKDEDFNNVINEYIQLKKDDTFQMASERLECATKVVVLRNKLHDMESSIVQATCKNKTLVYKVAPYLRVMVVAIDKIYDDIPPHLKTLTDCHRIKPFFVMISGPSRIGKSKIFQPILVNALVMALGILKKYQDPHTYCCFRVAGREFWDGGQGKDVIWYNDLFQGIMNENGIDLALEEIASVVDDNPYHMNMSDVKDKARCYLTSPLVVANVQCDTTNLQPLNARVLSRGEHLARRRDINCVLELQDKWKLRDETMDKVSVANFVRDHPDQCYGIQGQEMFPKDLYWVTFLDVRTGYYKFRFDFENAIKYIVDTAKNYFQAQNILTDRLKENMKGIWPQMYCQTDDGLIAEESELDKDEVYEDALDVGTQTVIHTRDANIQVNDLVTFQAARFVRNIIVHEQPNGMVVHFDLGIETHNAVTGARVMRYSAHRFHLNDYTASMCVNYANVTISWVSRIITYWMSFKSLEFAVPILAKVTFQGMSVLFDLLHGGKKDQTNFQCCLMVLGMSGMFSSVAVGTFWAHRTFITHTFPYVIWAVRRIAKEGLTIFYASIDEFVQNCIHHDRLGLFEFISWCKRKRDNIYIKLMGGVQSIKVCVLYIKDYIIMHMPDIPTDVHWYDEFKRRALQLFNGTIFYLTSLMRDIPGWIYLTGGSAIFGASAWLYYDYLNRQVPQSHEGNMKAKRRRIARKLGKKDTPKTTMIDQSYNDSNKEIERIIRHNYCYLSMETEIKENLWIRSSVTGMALNLKSNIFVMPYHYWYRFQYCNNLYVEHSMKSRIQFKWSAKETTVAYFDMIDVCKPDYPHAGDVIYFRVRRMNCGRDISKYFISEEQEPILVDSYLYGYRPRGDCDFSTTEILQIGKITTVSKNYEVTELSERILGEIIPSETIHYDYCYYYTDCMTGPGDCTMVLMHTDARTPNKIIGIHTAGNTNQHTGVAAPIYREDIDEVVNYFHTDEEPVISIEIDHQYADYVTDTSVKAQEFIDEGFQVIANTSSIKVNGKIRRITASMPSQNKIQHSIVYDRMEEDFGPSTVLPTALSKRRDDQGNIISPFFKAFKKMNNFTNNIPQRIHDDIVEHCSQSLVSWPSQWNKGNARLLTWDEAINGYMDLKGLDLTTSSGFPYTLRSCNKKNWFINDGQKWIMNDELMSTVLSMEEKLKKGIIPPVYFIDTLKDETRPIQKVKDCKTRLFQVGSMAWTILFRKYFGWFVGHCQSTFNFGEMMTGINPNSYDWDMIARQMIAISKWHDNGDYETYDSTLGHQAATSVADGANYFYSFGYDPYIKVSNLVRLALILGSINTLHIVHDFIIMRRQGNPSGFFLTTVINDWCNMYYNRYAFIKLTGLSLREFRHLIYAIFFGDDKDATVAEQIAEKFNMKTYSEIMATLGLKYTSASKKEITTPLLTIEEITFLKRSFIWDNNMQIWRSQLNHDVVMEIPRWSEGDPTNIKDQTNRFNSCLMELANYSEYEFNFVKSKFQIYIHELSRVGYNFNVHDLFTYHYCMHIMYPKHFPSATPYLELAISGQQQIIVLPGMGAERNLCKLLKYNQIMDDETHLVEQSYVSQSSINNLDGISLTKGELRVIKKRIGRAIQKSASRIRPLIRGACDQIVAIVLEACPCYGAKQVYDVVVEMYNSGELHQLIEVIPEEEQEQVSPQGVDDETPVENTTEKQTIARFEDVNEMHVAPGIPNQHIGTHQAVENISLAQFLSRPYIVQSYQWTGSEVLYANVMAIEFPYVLTSIASIANKMQNIAWWAPDIEITIRANTTVFHYGGICFNWIPQAKYLNSTYKTCKSAMNSKNWTQLLANSRQAIRFTVPYTHYKNKLTIGKETVGSAGGREDLFTMFAYITWPLMTAQASAVAPINISVYARVLNPRMSGYIVDSFTPQGFDEGEFLEPQGLHDYLYPSKRVNKEKEKFFQNNAPGLIDDDLQQPTEDQLLQDQANSINNEIRLLQENKQHDELTSGYKLPQYDDSNKYGAFPPQVRTIKAKPKPYGFDSEHAPTRNFVRRLNGRTPNLRPQGGDVETEEASGGRISGAILAVADFVGKFSPIPFLGAIASPVSAITATAGYFAKWMGFSVTASSEAPMPMQIRQPLWQRAEDTTLSIPLIPGGMGNVAKDFKYVNSFADEMSMENFWSTPGMIYTGTIAATYAPGQILFRRAISPYEMYCSDWNTPYPSGATGYTTNCHYVVHAIQQARAWRGSFKFDINFFSTQFHSCRIALVYQPYQAGVSPTVLTIYNYTNALNTTYDVQAGQTFSFVVPYDQRCEWLSLPTEFRSSANTQTLYENNGYITAILINELTSVISNPIAIGFQIMVTPCQDFQIMGYQHINNALGGAQFSTGITPQGIDDVEMCDYPASSITCLKQTKPFVFGEHSGYKVAQIHHSFEITSIRQLMNMANNIYAGVASPSFVSVGLNDLTLVWSYANVLRWTQAYFRYKRGGIRLMGMATSSTITGVVGCGIAQYNRLIYQTAPVDLLKPLNARNESTTAINNATGFYMSNLASRSPVDAIIPYYYRWKCIPTTGLIEPSYLTTLSTFYPQDEASYGYIQMNESGYYNMSAADDYLAGWILPSPMMYYGGVAGSPGTNPMPRSIEEDQLMQDMLKRNIQPIDDMQDHPLINIQERIVFNRKYKQLYEREQKLKNPNKPPEININNTNDLMGPGSGIGSAASSDQKQQKIGRPRNNEFQPRTTVGRARREVETDDEEDSPIDSADERKTAKIIEAAIYR